MEEKLSSYRGSLLQSLQDKLSKSEISPYTCMEGVQGVCQLAQLAYKYLQKQMHSGRLAKNDKMAKYMVDRPQRVPTDQTYGRWPQNNGRWPQAMAGEVWGWPTSHSLPLKSKTQVFGAKPNTKQSSREILRQGAWPRPPGTQDEHKHG